MKDDTRVMTKQEMSRHLGAALRQARLGAGLTLGEVALHAGLAPEVYQRVERGSMTPDLLSLRTLCMMLELGLDVALGLVETPRPSRREKPEPVSEDSPQLLRLLRTVRRLEPKQIALLTVVARGYAKDTRR